MAGKKTALKTSIVILTHNHVGYTMKCLDSIIKYTDPGSYEIIVVDNNSSDGTAEYLEAFSRGNNSVDIKLILNKENLGFPKGCNQGIKASLLDYVLLLNNDTIVTSNWLSNLLKCAGSSEKIGAVGPVTNYCSNYQAINIPYKEPGEEMQLFARQYNIPDEKLWEERLNLIGYCLLLKRKVLDKVGYLDEDFSPGNYEDDDLSIRIIKAGYKLVLCRDTFIHHHGSKSFKESNAEFAEILRTNSKKFENKWGFNRDYSLYIRYDLISLLPQNSDDELNFLEAGCACGATLLKIKNIFKKANLFGIELNPAAADIAGRFASVTVSDIENSSFDYPKKFFNYVILADILEHLKSPWDFLSVIKEYLVDGGSILSSIPNVMHISVINQLLKGHWKYTDAGILDKTHLRFFTLDAIIDMFSGCGFKINTVLQNRINLSEEEKKLFSELGNICVTGSNILQQMQSYQYIFEAKKV